MYAFISLLEVYLAGMGNILVCHGPPYSYLARFSLALELFTTAAVFVTSGQVNAVLIHGPGHCLFIYKDKHVYVTNIFDTHGSLMILVHCSP